MLENEYLKYCPGSHYSRGNEGHPVCVHMFLHSCSRQNVLVRMNCVPGMSLALSWKDTLAVICCAYQRTCASRFLCEWVFGPTEGAQIVVRFRSEGKRESLADWEIQVVGYPEIFSPSCAQPARLPMYSVPTDHAISQPHAVTVFLTLRVSHEARWGPEGARFRASCVNWSFPWETVCEVEGCL